MKPQPKYFRPECPASCMLPKNGRHHHPGAFEAYWQSLNTRERQSLRDKANWEHMTLSAVGRIWGAIDAD